MKLIRQTRLEFQEGKSDKVYEVDLCEAGAGEFLVNFRYGRRGSNLRDGTKTVYPVTRAQAESLFEKLIAEKTGKGYHLANESGLPISSPPTTSPEQPSNDDPRRVIVRERLTKAAQDRKSIPQSWSLSRLIWRAGLWAMRESADSIAALVPQLKSPMECWCAVWALGRLGEKKHLSALDLLNERAAQFSDLHNILPEAYLVLGHEPEPSVHLPPALTELWESAKDEWEGTEEARSLFRETCEKQLRSKALNEEHQRELVFLTARHPWLHEFVYHLLRSLPIQQGSAAFFRQALKSAEFRLDAELYGQVMRRYESTQGEPIPYYTPRGYKAPVASSTTMRYFRRRAMRFLKDSGESGNPALFVPLATGILAAFDDDMSEAKAKSFTEWTWDPETRRSSYDTIYHPEFANCLSFLFLLRGKEVSIQLNRRKTGWRFRDEQSGNPTTREEAYPELWNQAPDAIIHLLRTSRCTLVQEFALRIWNDNPSFLGETDNTVILDFLDSWFEGTRQLGFAIAREKWDPSAPNRTLLLAMLRARLDEARMLGCEWVDALPDDWLNDSDYLSAVAFLPYEDGRIATRERVRSLVLEKETKQEFIAKVISGLLALDSEDESAGPAVDWLWQIAPEQTTALPDEHTLNLIRHPGESCQLLALRILLERPDVSTLPEELLLSSVLSNYPSVRKLGISLLAKLPDHQLAERTDTLAACAVSPHEELRSGTTPLLARISTKKPEASRELVTKWYPLLFRQEAFEGLHASLFETLTSSFTNVLDVIPQGEYHQMLASSHGYGQQLGFVIMQREVSNPSQDQLGEWANHELMELRVWSCERLNRDQLRHDPKVALQLLESPYTDTRNWAFKFCREDIQDEDWTPGSLVAVCDSTFDEVRAFGREQVTRLFREEDGPLYLARLSQHPSTEIQLFASNYLERYGSGQPERIAALDLYFRTVLSRIGAGRVAKKRVMTFLEREALADHIVATQVTALLARQSGTVAIQDKAEMIRVMRAIQVRWPDIDSPLKPKPVEVHQEP